VARGRAGAERGSPRARAEATGGRIGGKHIRAIQTFSEETGWHWRDMNAHFVYALKGWIRFRFKGADEGVTVVAGSCLSQPGGVAHNVSQRAAQT
jgi:quercetin dioxygenase-like cupin family protein